MSKFVNSVLIGLVSFLVLLSLFWYVAEVRGNDQITVEKVEPEWGAVDAGNTELIVRIQFHNPHRTQARFDGLQYEVRIGDQVVAQGDRNESRVLAPRADFGTDISVRFSNAWIEKWWQQRADLEETSTLQVRGTAMFVLAQNAVRVTFESDQEADVGLSKPLEDTLPNCGSNPPTPCIERATTRWTQPPGGEPALVTALVLKNPGDSSLRILNWSSELRLAGVTIARTETSSSAELGPRGNARLEPSLAFDAGQMGPWWVKHVQNCEESDVVLTVRFTLMEERPGGAGTPGTDAAAPGLQQTVVSDVAWDFHADPLVTHWVCGG